MDPSPRLFFSVPVLGLYFPFQPQFIEG